MSGLTCSLDIGNGYIKGVLFLTDYDDKTSIVAKDMVKSSGIKKGKVLDANNLIKSISKVLDSLSKKVDNPIDEVILGLSHPGMKVKQASTHKRLINIEITESDVSSLLENVSDMGDELNYEILKIIPSKWVIDDEHITKNPVGMQGRKLELIANIFMIPSSTYKDIEKIFDELGIDIIDFVPNILGAEEGCLDVETKDLGCVLIDIGANQTSFVIYEEGNNLGYGVIPVGGEEITKDISIGLKIDYVQAEQIKKEEGEIIIEKNQANTKDSKIDKLFLSEIIEARLAEDIYKPIIEYMDKLEVNGKLPGGVILTGGASKIKNIEEFTRNYFGLACKIGKINNPSFYELGSNPLFVNCIGNYIWEEKYGNDSGFSWGLNLGFLKNISEWFKKIF